MTTFTDAYLCRMGGLRHRWDVIPVEYEPNTWFTYVDIDNMRCERCGLVKAILWDSQGDWLLRYKSKTGLQLTPDDARPTREDMRQLLKLRAASIEDRNTRRAAKTKATPAKAKPKSAGGGGNRTAAA